MTSRHARRHKGGTKTLARGHEFDFNLQQVQAVEVPEGVLTDAGYSVGIQQSEKIVQNANVEHILNTDVEQQTHT
jgi:hypothetical protein